MNLSHQTIKQLVDLINYKTEYRTGSQLVTFFNNYGFNDSYGPGFPSRGAYTESRLNALNGKSELDRCIKDLFAPINFVSRFSDMESLIAEFNRFLSFDGWQVVRRGSNITIQKAAPMDIDKEIRNQYQNSEQDFLETEFKEIPLDSLPVEASLVPYLEARIKEIGQCVSVAPLSTIFLIGSTLEGILLGVALNNSEIYNRAEAAPKDFKTGKVRKFDKWTLNDFIDVSYEVGFLKEDVKKFSHVLRDFRNYIHPYLQMSRRFQPDTHTARICFQVLRAALYQIEQKSKK